MGKEILNKQLLILIISLLLMSCTQSSKQLSLNGEKVNFIFDKTEKSISAYSIKEDDGYITTNAYKSNSTLADYFILLNGEQINFNPTGIDKNSGLQFSYSDSLFSANISWKILFEDAALIEYTVIPKSDHKSLSLGINAIKINPSTIENVYCIPHSLPYFRNEENNKVPSGWISNAGTSNNTFSLITKQATLSLSILPPEHRLGNILTEEAIQDYAVSFDYNGDKIDMGSVWHRNESKQCDYTGAITALVNHPFSVNKGDTIVRKFIVHVSGESEDYTTGKHIGQYMATVPYEKEVNSNELYSKSMDFLLNNSGCFNESEKHGNNYWGSVHSETGEAFGNGTAYYAMYGNSFSIAALNQYSKLVTLDEEGKKRLKGVKDFLTKSPIQNQDGSYWSMLLLLEDQVKYSDQAYREWVWTHATAWVSYYMLEAYDISGDESILEAVKKSLNWLVLKQREDGSFPKYFDKGEPSEDNQGDAGWNALAFFKAAELNITLDNDENPEKLIQRGIKTVDWISENQLPNKNFYGSFEDVGGVVDCYASTICSRATFKAYSVTKNTKYLQAGKSMLTSSLAWVTCDYNTRNHDVEIHCWAKDKQWQPAYAHLESTSCYYPCSYTLPMLYLAATEYAAIAPEKEKLFWVKIAQNMSHLNTFINSNPDSKSINGMEWRLFPFLVFTEWGNGQTCWTILETLTNRLSLSYPEIIFSSDLKTTINGEEAVLALPSGLEQNCIVGPEVDYLTLITSQKDKAFLGLLAEGTKGERIVKMSKNFLASALNNDSKIKLTDVSTNKEIGTFSREELIQGISIYIDEAILIGLLSTSGNN